MADSAPLISSIEEIIESYIGATTVTQILQACFISLAWIFDAQQTFISIFADAEPKWHCTNNNTSCSPCTSSTTSWAWDQPAHATSVSEWNLVCSSSILAGLPASSHFFGCFIGIFFLGTLADSILGRKKMLVLSCLTMSISAALTVVSPNIWVYLVLRFLCGASRSTITTSTLVLLTEIVRKEWRERLSIFCFICFCLGFLSLPGLAYLNEGSSWRNFYLWTSIPLLVYTILMHMWIQESPRWLLVRGRRDEAIDSIKKIASSNANIRNSSFSRLVAYEVNLEADFFSSYKMLGTKWACRRLLSVMVVGFGVGLLYYGMPLSVGNLGSNLYLSVTFNALAELQASILTFFLTSKLNRKVSLLILTTVSGVSSIACVFVTSTWLKMTMEVFSYFVDCTAFNILLIYTVELFPTCVRNSAVLMLRQVIFLSGIVAPILVVEGRKKSLSFGAFGVTIGFCGLLTAGLPETKGTRICDTMEEEEQKQIVLHS